ncbi:MAG: DUF4440 domain-containing protein [Candidatus Hydrogenedentes bacterium]|nr:DUF4440 domain-containing protein [Candidatus Hydrogenedentota bacterium]
MFRKTMTKALIALVLVGILGGCATFQKGPSDEEMIAAMMDAHWAAIKANDLDKTMQAYSEDFSGQNAETKSQVRDFFADAIDQGYMDELEIDNEQMQIVVDGDTATAGPVTYSVSQGSATADYTLKKENGAWKIVGAYMF